jgi:hypothetical protein
MTLEELKQKINNSGWINKDATLRLIETNVFVQYKKSWETENYTGVYHLLSVFSSFTASGLKNNADCVLTMNGRQTPYHSLLTALRDEVLKTECDSI